MGDHSRPSLEDVLRKLEPQNIRANLVRAGLCLAGWEMLKAEIQGKVKSFYVIGFDENGFTSDDYQSRVLSRHPSRFEASLQWLVEAGALTDAEADQVRDLRAYRNEVAHELPKMMVEVGHDIDVARLRVTKDLLGRLGVFWGRIEVDVNPDLHGEEINDESIRSGVMLLMEHLVAVAEDVEPKA